MFNRFALLTLLAGLVELNALHAETGSGTTLDVTVDTRNYPFATTGGVAVDTRDPPTLSSATASGLGSTGATLGATVLGDGGATIQERGIVYALAAVNGNPIIGGNGVTQLISNGTTGEFSLSATGLPVGSSFVFKAYASNIKGVSYTSSTAFITLTLLEGWRQTQFGITASTGNAADNADPDGDGLKNLLEYALNLPPNAAGRVPASVQATGGNLEYLYDRGTAAFNSGTTYQVEWSDDLTTWSGAGVVETLLSDDGTTQQVKATLPAGSGGRRFVRLRVQ